MYSALVSFRERTPGWAPGWKVLGCLPEKRDGESWLSWPTAMVAVVRDELVYPSTAVTEPSLPLVMHCSVGVIVPVGTVPMPVAAPAVPGVTSRARPATTEAAAVRRPSRR